MKYTEIVDEYVVKLLPINKLDKEVAKWTIKPTAGFQESFYREGILIGRFNPESREQNLQRISGYIGTDISSKYELRYSYKSKSFSLVKRIRNVY